MIDVIVLSNNGNLMNLISDEGRTVEHNVANLVGALRKLESEYAVIDMKREAVMRKLEELA